MTIEKVFFKSEGQRVAGMLHLPGNRNPPCVIASHGLLSSKDSDKYITLGEALGKKGMALLRFDFRGCGESEGKLVENTVSGRIADLRSAIDFVKAHPKLADRMGLLGSSLGGYVSLVLASMERGVRASVIWSTPFHLDGLESKQGTEDVPPLGKVFFEDLPKHRLLPLLPGISNCLVLHGEADETVPVNHAWEIFQGLGSPKEIHVIEGGDHRISNPVHRRRALDLSIAWFQKYLIG